MSLLEIKNLHAGINGNDILKGINLEVNLGEVHAIMGPNGSGKSTLAGVIAGRNEYEIKLGQILYKNKDLSKMTPEERAREGIFLAFQYPVEIPGVTNLYFLKSAFNAIRKYRGLEEVDTLEFLSVVRNGAELVGLDESFLNRPVNEGFSGGEKKRNEVLQMAILQPTLSILDETDSGLDIDALKTIAEGVNKMHSDSNAIVIVTHYQRLLNYIMPDYVHVLIDGKIVKSGDKNLALVLEDKGYDWLKVQDAK